MQIQWTDLAGEDLEEIEAYIARDNSTGVAVDVILRLLDVIESVLPDYPQAGRVGRVEGTREMVIDGLPFIVIYRIAMDIQILRVLHEAQNWPQ